jgi:hypothetical protein
MMLSMFDSTSAECFLSCFVHLRDGNITNFRKVVDLLNSDNEQSPLKKKRKFETMRHTIGSKPLLLAYNLA